MTNRKGPLTVEEKAFIEDNVGKMSYADMGRKLKRGPSTIRKFADRKKISKKESDTEIRIKSTLENSPHMKELEKQFSPEEMERVKHDWTNITRQFKGDILYTEEMQILDYIRIGVLMDRFLSQENKMSKDLADLDDKLIELEKKKGKEDAPKDLRAQIESIMISKMTLLGEIGEAQKGYKDLIDKRERAAKSIHGSREQRSKKEQLSKETIKDWVLSLYNNSEKRREIGMYMEKMRIAIREEYVRLSEVHKYFNDEWDIPVLNSETVGNLEQVGVREQNGNGDGHNGSDGQNNDGQADRKEQNSGSGTASFHLKSSAN